MSEIPTIPCSICGNTDWVNVDEYRLKPEGMCMCSRCGFCTYPQIIAKSEDLREFYRNEYRAAPSVANVFTGQRKLHYHAAFLGELFETWKKEKRKPVVFEVGAAFGMFLRWVRDNFQQSEVLGSELTLTYRRNAWHEYQLRLLEDFDDSRKYDLVATYKVLEHMPYPEKELRRYALALKEDGLLYVSVPTWFHTMSNFGVEGFSLDYYYDKNHVNVWTRPLFETLLKKCGLEIVKVDYVYYDSTYLCRRNDALMDEVPLYEDPAAVIDRLARVKKASLAFDDGKFDEAIQHFPAFPDALVALYEKNRSNWHQKGFPAIEKSFLESVLKDCPNNHRITFLCGDICMRYDQWEKAIRYFETALQQKPNDPAALTGLGNCFRQLAERAQDPAEKARLYGESRKVMRHMSQVSLQHMHEAITWIFADNAKIPMPDEVSHGKPEETRVAAQAG